MTSGQTASRPHPDSSGVPFEERSALKNAVGNWCLRNAASCLQKEALEQAAQWDLLAAHALDLGCEPLASPELERQLVEIAGRLPTPPVRPAPWEPRSQRWLHVLNEVYPYGGHTATLQRWISSDPRPNRHSVALLSQRTPVPEPLVEVVEGTGGSIVRFDRNAPLLDQATWLRAAAWSDADVVILHIHPWDAVSSLAFGIPGGPPVLFMNHAAHVFWTGASVSDAVLNHWVSAQEDEWVRTHRGVDRILHLTIPLVDPAETPGEPPVTPEARRAARHALQLPPDAPILLTVGADYKYTPAPNLDFVETAVVILQSCPDAHLIAVGVTEDARWKAAGNATGGRLRATGLRTPQETATYRAASDVYLEGFPFGSTTALLEAGIRGLPCVRCPKTCPPPFATDDVAVAVTDQPRDSAEYAARAIALVRDPRERERLGGALAASIRAHHVGPGWVRYLDDLERERPTGHRIRALPDLPPVPRHLAAFWGIFTTVTWRADPFGVTFRAAIQRGLRPRTDAELVRAVRAARRGRGGSAPSESVLHQCGWLLSRLSPPAALGLYDRLLLLRHDGRIMRTLQAIGARPSAGARWSDALSEPKMPLP
jgi:hypothetical protein